MQILTAGKYNVAALAFAADRRGAGRRLHQPRAALVGTARHGQPGPADGQGNVLLHVVHLFAGREASSVGSPNRIAASSISARIRCARSASRHRRRG